MNPGLTFEIEPLVDLILAATERLGMAVEHIVILGSDGGIFVGETEGAEMSCTRSRLRSPWRVFLFGANEQAALLNVTINGLGNLVEQRKESNDVEQFVV